MADTYVVTGAMMTCTFGMAPSSFIATPSRTCFLSSMQRGNIMDFTPMVNIMPFGMCSSMANPTVAAATSAAMGVLTPMPCIPAITAPWMPGKMQVMVQGQPALTRSCQNLCMWGGQITFTTDGQMPGPPPIIVPPLDISVSLPTPNRPFPASRRSEMTDEEQQQYDSDIAQASKAGDTEQFMSDSLNRTAANYASQGQSAKANKASQASQNYSSRAASKQSDAIGEVNNRYGNGSKG